MNPFRVIFVLFLAIIAIAGNSLADSFSGLRNNVDGTQTLIGHVPLEVRNSMATFKYHALSSEYINARIILPLQNQTQLSSLLKGLYDPTSPSFHQFITPAQFAQQFGSSSVYSQQVKSYLNSQGISVTGQSLNGTVLNVSGSVPAIEKAFGLHINHYQKSDGTMFFAPDAEPTIPTTLAGKVLAIGGLDNLPKYHPFFHQFPSNAVANTALGTGPGGFLSPNDIKTAYNLNGIPSTGAGQNIALFELDGYASSDITTYDAQFGLLGVPLQNVLIDGFSGAPDCTPGALNCTDGNSNEVTLDIETLTAFAPGASNILVYEASNNGGSGWIDEWTQIASDNKAKIISCSWGLGGGGESDSPTENFDNIIFQQMAAQGQAVFSASGDRGAYEGAGDGNTSLAVQEPSAQPYVTAVGISTLQRTNGVYKDELASVYGGGGISAFQSIPPYQTTVVSQAVSGSMVSSTMRNVPDVVLTADRSTSYAFYINGSWEGFYGSSVAAPIWASFMSLVNQGLWQNGPLGFANPSLYQLARNSSSYTNDFHDITTGNNGYPGSPYPYGTGYPAEIGFDDATGLGSFNGLNLYNDLITQSNPSPLQSPPIPTGLSFSISTTDQVVLKWNASLGATSYNITRASSINGQYVTVGSLVPLTTFTDNTGSNGNTYYYAVSAVNAKGESAFSAPISVNTPVLLPPSGFTAISENPQAEVFVSWNTSTGAYAYNVKRATVSGGPYITIANNLKSTFYYNDYSVVSGTTYYYVVSALNKEGESLNSPPFTVTPVFTAPLTPTNVEAQGEPGSVQVTWIPAFVQGLPSGSGFAVKRATISGGPYSTMATTDRNSSSYTDSSVTIGTTYYYLVSAVNQIGESPNSPQVSAIPVALYVPPSPPPAPTSLTASETNGQVTVNWKPSSGATSYTVLRAIASAGPYAVIAKNFIGTSLVDNSIAAVNTTYYYEVVAVNAGGNSPASLPVSVATLAPPVNPPTSVTATAGDSHVILTWVGNTRATSYLVERGTVSGGPYPATVRVGGNSTTNYNDTSAINGTTYYYVVLASNSGGNGPASAQVSATPTASTTLPLPPTSPIVWETSGYVVLEWTASTKASSYTIERSTNGGPYSIVATNVPLFYKDTSIANGVTYSYEVLAVNALGSSAPTSPVSVTTAAALPTTPVVNAFETKGAVSVEWNVDSLAASYTVQRATVSGGPYTVLASNVLGWYSDTSVVANTTYYYEVMAVNGLGNSPVSAPVSVTTISPPAAPTSVTATAGTAQVSLTWVASAHTLSYIVERSTVSGGPYSTTFNVSGSPTSYTDTSVTNGTTYYYVILASNVGGLSPASTQVSATPNGIVPSAPTGLTAALVNGQVVLTWNSSINAVGYNVKLATVSGGPYTFVASTVNTTYTDINVSNAVTYYFVVSAVNSVGESPDSAQTSVTVTLMTPSTPGGLTAKGESGQIYLTWNQSPGATQYNVKRATVSSGPYVTITNSLMGTPPLNYFTDTAVNNGTTYYYVVSASNSAGESPNSTQVSATPQAPPAAPTGFTAKPGNGQVTLSWTDSLNATLYTIERSTVSGGPYSIIGTATGNSNGYPDNTVTNGTTYYYVILASNVGGLSPASTQVSATPMASPPIPAGLTTSAGSNLVVLNWTASTGATSYNVKRSNAYGGPFTTIYSQLPYHIYEDTTVTNGTTYYYVVSALNGSVESGNSQVVSATPMVLPAAPAGLTVGAVLSNEVELTWTAVPGAASYWVFRATANGGPYTNIAKGILKTFYNDSSVSDGITYYYVVMAVNTNGYGGAYSNQVSATPLAVPAAPTNLAVGAVLSNDVELTWSATPGAASYEVLRSTVSGGPYTSIATSVLKTYYNDSSITDGTTYYYVVEAVNANHYGSLYSTQVSATPLATPPAPTGLKAIGGLAQVGLTWTATPGAVSYVVSRSTLNGGPYNAIAVAISNTFYNDTSVVDQTTYYYVVQGVNANHFGGPNSAQVSATPEVGSPIIAPMSLIAVPGNGQVKLTWAGRPRATFYIVKRSTVSGGPYSISFTVLGNSTTNFTDTSVTNGITYYYVVLAANQDGNGPASTQVSAKPQAPTGFFDGINSNFAGGWAYSPNLPTSSINVSISIDGVTVNNAVPTNSFRSDVNVTIGIKGNHGFSWPIPTSYFDGKAHLMHIYAVDPSSGKTTELNESPRTFTLNADQPPTGFFDGINSNLAQGWAYSPNVPTSSINVSISIDGETVNNAVPTNIFRGDVNTAMSTTGNHGFSWTIPTSYYDGKAHVMHIYAVDPASGKTTELNDSPRSFTIVVGT